MRSIRTRLTLGIVIGGGGLLALLFSALDLLIDHQLYSRFDEALVARGRALATALGADVTGDRATASAWPEFGAENHTDFYQLWDADGSTVLRSASSHGADFAPPPQAPDGEPVLYDLVLPDGHRGRAAAFDLGTRTFAIAAEREAIDALESRIHAMLVAGAGIAVPLMLVLSLAAVRAGLRPLELFGKQAAARALAPEAGHAPADPPPVELLPIASALDDAFGELSRALLRERRFARDLAHELRTPLAEMFGLVETMQPADAVSRERLVEVAGRLAGMSRIVDGLLALARYEAGIDVPVVEPVDAAAIARVQCGAARLRAEKRGIAIDERIDAELWLITDPLLFERILANLLGNAVDHAPDGSLVEVFCRAQDDDVSLVIANAAPGLTPEDVAQLGERHFRAPGGAPATGHAGLGLALCTALAAPLGIRLAFDLENGRLWVRLAGLRTLDSAL